MPAATALTQTIVALGGGDGFYMEIIQGTLPATSPATFTSKLQNPQMAGFTANAAGAAATVQSFAVSGSDVVLAFDQTAYASAKFGAVLIGKR